MKYSCMQFLDTTFGDFAGSDMWNAKSPVREDCLYLHVWVPHPRKNNKRAVMVRENPKVSSFHLLVYSSALMNVA